MDKTGSAAKAERSPGIETRFVLVRSRIALNIGAAARALSNFGFEDLVAVAPAANGWREAKSAIYASELLGKTPVLSLEEAVADRHLILGTASLHNRAHRRTTVDLGALSLWLKRRLPKGGRAAILFGSETNGLANEELDYCHAVIRIPTVPQAPSMNLGQAVALVAYELARSGLERSVAEPEERLAEGVQLSELVETAMRAMAETGVNAHMPERVRRARFRRGLLKWRMSRADANWLHGLLSKLLGRR